MSSSATAQVSDVYRRAWECILKEKRLPKIQYHPFTQISERIRACLWCCQLWLHPFNHFWRWSSFLWIALDVGFGHNIWTPNLLFNLEDIRHHPLCSTGGKQSPRKFFHIVLSNRESTQGGLSALEDLRTEFKLLFCSISKIFTISQKYLPTVRCTGYTIHPFGSCLPTLSS